MIINAMVSLVIIGAVIMFLSIARLFSNLSFFLRYTYKAQISGNWIYYACMGMMIFFLIGYIIFAFILFGTTVVTTELILVSVIFFFGSIFVYSMVFMQQKLSRAIAQRTIETVYSLINAVEAKDVYTKGHSEHVCNLTIIFCRHLPKEYLSKMNLSKLFDAAMLHDIGKIGIPDAVLNKPGALTDEEFTIIKQHPERGYNILSSTIYNQIGRWILYHHERIDGQGYYQLSSEKIPLESKIIAITDTFSALFTDRVYRKKFSFEKCIEILKSCAGTQLDAELVAIFCSIDKSEILSATVA